ncbi:zinc finger CCCH domain-containing protein 39 isoform X2 [Populus alba]|uniref:zinc finger CCCH domain-containing protein 39 isoform X2 n=1 Tax=Populus alba TaxID=43335 RepID=UPI00158CB219|nr:zinc finger CCCH domain-containing protein 39-like isoform X2 [Populus alba]
MSYPDSPVSFMASQASYQSGSDAIDVWPQFVMNNNEQFEQQQQHQPAYKRPRNSEDNSNQSMSSRVPPTNSLPVHKGTTNIFFKTRVCAKFKTGTCRNGENCNFAHGMQDLRQPPPNWKELVSVGVSSEEDRSAATNREDDLRIIHKMKLCKKFYNGEECPYGDRCNFLHEDPANFREDMGRFRESSAISIGTTDHLMGQGSGVLNAAEVNRPANTAVSDAPRSNLIKPVYWKTKLCTKWEMTGQCPFGEKCHFAHGLAELQVPGGRTEVEAGNAGSAVTKAPTPVLPNNMSPSMTVNVPSLVEEKGTKCLLKWKGQKKINRIYADWLDDLSLVHNSTNQVQNWN